MLVDRMMEENKKTWGKVITSTDLTHNSCKAYETINNLSNDPATSNPSCLVNSIQVVHQVDLNNQQGKWRNQNNDLLHGSIISPLLISNYTNKQPLHDETLNFISENNICATAQRKSQWRQMW